MYESKELEHIRNVTTRCRGMCSAEAVLLDLPPEAGEEMHDGIVHDAMEDWSESYFWSWVNKILEKYGIENEQKLLTLYDTCHTLMNQYGEMMNQGDNQ